MTRIRERNRKKERRQRKAVRRPSDARNPRNKFLYLLSQSVSKQASKQAPGEGRTHGAYISSSRVTKNRLNEKASQKSDRKDKVKNEKEDNKRLPLSQPGREQKGMRAMPEMCVVREVVLLLFFGDMFGCFASAFGFHQLLPNAWASFLGSGMVV